MMYIPKGVEEASHILSISTDFLIYYDPDIDGGVSGEYWRRVLTKFQKPFNYYINSDRQHGLKLSDDNLKTLKGKTIILVDAGMSKAEIEKVTSFGIHIINIDHHEIDEEEFVYYENKDTGAKGVIINNQYPFEPEEFRFLSGAGVGYYVIKALFPKLFGEEEKALVGLTLLSDIRAIDSDLAREFLHCTYNFTSPYIEYLIKATQPPVDYGFGVQTFDRNFIDYTFSPKINALFRLNKGYEAIDIFAGRFTNFSDLDVYRRIQKGVVDSIEENLQGTSLSNLEFRFVDSDVKLPYEVNITNFIGVACSQVAGKGKTAILFVREDGKIKRGSLRGLCDDVDYLSLFRQYGFDARGHKNACGILSLDESKLNLEELNEKIRVLEDGYIDRKYTGKVLEVNNLDFFTMSKNCAIADINNYVRDFSRYYIMYTGKNIEAEPLPSGKAVMYKVDGQKVMCFEQGVDLSNGLILPIKERGKYINFYLKRY